MATTIQVSEELVARLKKAKEEFEAASYEEVIDKLIRRHEARKLFRRSGVLVLA